MGLNLIWFWLMFSKNIQDSKRLCNSMQNIKIFCEFLHESSKKSQKMSPGSKMWSKSKTKNSHYHYLEAAQPKHLWNEESGFAPPETILTYCISSKDFDNNIFYLFLFRRESGLESFVPTSLAESMKRKELKKLLGHFLKLNSSLTAPGNYFNFKFY